jgi:preprotein translocase subunit SecB
MQFTLIAQYLLRSSVSTTLRPYQNQSALAMEVSANAAYEPLPEPHHLRVVLEVTVTGENAKKEPCFSANAAREAIVVCEVEDSLRNQVLAHGVLAYLYASLRCDISQALAPTGFGPVVLPPVAIDQLVVLLERAAPPGSPPALTA